MNRKEFYNTLSDEVKAKIKACKTEEEMLRVLGEERIDLGDDLLDSLSGGYGDGYGDRCKDYCKSNCMCV